MATHEQWTAWIQELRQSGLADWFHQSMENESGLWEDASRWRLRRELFTDAKFAGRAAAVFSYAFGATGTDFTHPWARRAAFLVVEAAYPGKIEVAARQPIEWPTVNLPPTVPADGNPLVELAKRSMAVLSKPEPMSADEWRMEMEGLRTMLDAAPVPDMRPPAIEARMSPEARRRVDEKIHTTSLAIERINAITRRLAALLILRSDLSRRAGISQSTLDEKGVGHRWRKAVADILGDDPRLGELALLKAQSVIAIGRLVSVASDKPRLVFAEPDPKNPTPSFFDFSDLEKNIPPDIRTEDWKAICTFQAFPGDFDMSAEENQFLTFRRMMQMWESHLSALKAKFTWINCLPTISLSIAMRLKQCHSFAYLDACVPFHHFADAMLMRLVRDRPDLATISSDLREGLFVGPLIGGRPDDFSKPESALASFRELVLAQYDGQVPTGRLVPKRTPTGQIYTWEWSWVESPKPEPLPIFSETPQPSSTIEGKPPRPIECEWSAPMSKAEIARRLLNDKKARYRKGARIIAERYGLHHDGGNKWCIRIDKMDLATRRRFDEPQK